MAVAATATVVSSLLCTASRVLYLVFLLLVCVVWSVGALAIYFQDGNTHTHTQREKDDNKWRPSVCVCARRRCRRRPKISVVYYFVFICSTTVWRLLLLLLLSPLPRRVDTPNSVRACVREWVTERERERRASSADIETILLRSSSLPSSSFLRPSDACCWTRRYQATDALDWLMRRRLGVVFICLVRQQQQHTNCARITIQRKHRSTYISLSALLCSECVCASWWGDNK